MQSEITREADADEPTFQVVPVTRANVPAIKQWPATGWHGHYHWLSTSSAPSSTVINTGDRVNLTIWDSQDNSLLTSLEQRSTQMMGLEVGPDGAIFVPYVDKVAIRGMSTSAARERIQSRLEAILPSAQVVLSLEQGQNSSVDVVGGVARPATYPMPSRNYKILSLLAEAGGIAPNLRNPQIRLIRGSNTYEISSEELYANGSKNVLLLPRDTVIVEQDDRAFTALGASGTEDLIYFPKDEVTALEALSLMGGLADSRADPKGVVVLREYTARQLRADGTGPERQQVVFTFDLTSADGLFAARNFHIHPQDTVLATESPVTNAQTIFGLLGSVFGLGRTVATLQN